MKIGFSGETCGVVQLLLLADVVWLQAAIVGVSKELVVAEDGIESLRFTPALEPALKGFDIAWCVIHFAGTLLASVVSIGAGRRPLVRKDRCCLLCCSNDVASTPST